MIDSYEMGTKSMSAHIQFYRKIKKKLLNCAAQLDMHSNFDQAILKLDFYVSVVWFMW